MEGREPSRGQLVGAWASLIGLGQGWLGYLVGQCLRLRREGAGRPGVGLRLVDATMVSRPVKGIGEPMHLRAKTLALARVYRLGALIAE